MSVSLVPALDDAQLDATTESDRNPATASAALRRIGFPGEGVPNIRATRITGKVEEAPVYK